MEIVSDYYTLTLTELFPALKLPTNFLEETPELESVEPSANVELNLEVDEANIAVVGNSGNQLSSNTDIHCDSEIGTSARPLDKGDSSNLLVTDQTSGSIIPIQENYDTYLFANIFWKDGRSLLDCQVQVMHDLRTRETI